MKQFFENKNACDIFMNDVRVEDEPLFNLKKMEVFKQKEIGIQKQMKRKLTKIQKNYMHKYYFGNQTIKMCCVGHFIVLMVTKKLT